MIPYKVPSGSGTSMIPVRHEDRNGDSIVDYTLMQPGKPQPTDVVTSNVLIDVDYDWMKLGSVEVGVGPR